MELEYEHGKIIMKNKVTTALDAFVLDFTRLLEKYVDYVVVSGYVVILFGRARGTEDIDTIIRHMDKPFFESLYLDLTNEGYYFLNPEDANRLYEMLEERLGIRIAKEDTLIPNVELKFSKDSLDKYSLDKRVEIIMGENHLFVSPIELQVAYKLYLGSNKDIEDAVYLWDIFEERIDRVLLREFMETLNVKGDSYGIGI
jgi:hypothetical protein